MKQSEETKKILYLIRYNFLFIGCALSFFYFFILFWSKVGENNFLGWFQQLLKIAKIIKANDYRSYNLIVIFEGFIKIEGNTGHTVAAYN